MKRISTSSIVALTAMIFQTLLSSHAFASNKQSNDASVLEMANVYQNRINEFKIKMNDSNASTAQKSDYASAYLNYALKEINSQTGGSGSIYSLLMTWHQGIAGKIAAGAFNEAAFDADHYAAKILGLL